MSTEEHDARLETWENDNQRGPHRTFHKHPGEGHHYSGSYPDLDDREIEWNDIIRSCVLYGPPGTTVRLYDSKKFKENDDVLQLVIQDSGNPITLNNLDSGHPDGVSWVKKKNGIAGKVSGIRWM